MYYTPRIQQDNAPCNNSLKYSREIHTGVLYRFCYYPDMPYW